MKTLRFDGNAYIPRPSDNCAVATRTLEAGSILSNGLKISSTVLEGHRFAIRPIRAGSPLTSWNRPFGVALCDIDPGSYVCNEGVLEELRSRELSFSSPARANFEDRFAAFQLDEKNFAPSPPIDLAEKQKTFEGFPRSERRGAGTRNYIAVVGTSSRSASFARLLARDFRGSEKSYPGLHGVVDVAHTEGGERDDPHNLEYVLRTLAGFAVHPNLGAVLFVDAGDEAVNNRRLLDYLELHSYPLQEIPHHFLSIGGDFESARRRAAEIIRNWLPGVAEAQRRPLPLSGLKIALQCGGSDSFSGITANPLVGAVAYEAVRNGGFANLAETVELVGAEAYVLEKVRDLETARRFLGFVEEFKERMSWHGHTPEGNPSGGNRFRGLYNIVLKSLGAAMKKDPRIRIDAVIDYGERMSRPGFSFMNSPGNDLESVAGQVASGANLIFFTTGSGSITNFPFVPTIKVLSTSGRFQLLSKDIDINAGRILEGISLSEAASEAFDEALEVASGKLTRGERAGHSQVSLWRNWRQSAGAKIPSEDTPSGLPVKGCAPTAGRLSLPWDRLLQDREDYRRRFGLVLPTSLCSSRVAAKIAEELNHEPNPSRELQFVSLPHTEGCGASGGISQELFVVTLLGHLLHPYTAEAALLEHGCEKVHNQFVRSRLEKEGVNPNRFGWFSIQLDGGIEAATSSLCAWFRGKASTESARNDAEPESLRLGLLADRDTPIELFASLASLVESAVEAGITVIVPASSPAALFASLAKGAAGATTAFAGKPATRGLHLMQSPTGHWVELVTGLASTGAELILAATSTLRQGHPMVPLLRLDSAATGGSCSDFAFRDPGPSETERLFELIRKTLRGEYVPLAEREENTDFQITRGLVGVSV